MKKIFLTLAVVVLSLTVKAQNMYPLYWFPATSFTTTSIEHKYTYAQATDTKVSKNHIGCVEIHYVQTDATGKRYAKLMFATVDSTARYGRMATYPDSAQLVGTSGVITIEYSYASKRFFKVVIDNNGASAGGWERTAVQITDLK